MIGAGLIPTQMITALSTSVMGDGTAAPSGMSALEGGSIAGFGAQAVCAVLDSISAGMGYYYQKQVLDTQLKMQEGHLQFQQDSAAVQRDSQLATAKFQTEGIQVQEQAQELNFKAIERRKKCEDKVIVQKVIKKEGKKTKDVAKAKFSPAQIRRIFNDQRSMPSYGNPARSLRA